MSIDVTAFHLVNVTDTCAVWNTLSSRTLYAAAKQAKVTFCITSFVHYECLVKKRSTERPQDQELQRRLRVSAGQGDFMVQEVGLQDLLAPHLLEHAGRIGKGEISSIAFAYRTRLAFMTDDQKARRVATERDLAVITQTTPQLFGWLVYSGRLLDGDYRQTVRQHADMCRPLAPHLEEAYNMALRARIRVQT